MSKRLQSKVRASSSTARKGTQEIAPTEVTRVTRPVKVSSPVIRLLCVDDHTMLVDGLKALFELNGQIEVVGRLTSADRLVDEVKRVNADAVLLDIEMPGADAFEMADRLRFSDPDVRVIVLSAHVRDAFISASFACGASAYFSKADDLKDIMQGIEEATRSDTATFKLGPKVLETCHPPVPREGTAIGRVRRRAGRSGAPLTRLAFLTPRESEILRLIGKGMTRQQVAAQICRSPKTVDGHQDRMMKKLKITTRADLMRFAIREGLAQA